MQTQPTFGIQNSNMPPSTRTLRPSGFVVAKHTECPDVWTPNPSRQLTHERSQPLAMFGLRWLGGISSPQPASIQNPIETLDQAEKQRFVSGLFRMNPPKAVVEEFWNKAAELGAGTPALETLVLQAKTYTLPVPSPKLVEEVLEQANIIATSGKNTLKLLNAARIHAPHILNKSEVKRIENRIENLDQIMAYYSRVLEGIRESGILAKPGAWDLPLRMKVLILASNSLLNCYIDPNDMEKIKQCLPERVFKFLETDYNHFFDLLPNLPAKIIDLLNEPHPVAGIVAPFDITGAPVRLIYQAAESLGNPWTQKCLNNLIDYAVSLVNMDDRVEVDHFIRIINPDFYQQQLQTTTHSRAVEQIFSGVPENARLFLRQHVIPPAAKKFLLIPVQFSSEQLHIALEELLPQVQLFQAEDLQRLRTKLNEDLGKPAQTTPNQWLAFQVSRKLLRAIPNWTDDEIRYLTESIAGRGRQQKVAEELKRLRDDS